MFLQEHFCKLKICSCRNILDVKHVIQVTKKRPGEEIRAAIIVRVCCGSESQLSSDLKSTRRSIRSQEGAEDAGGGCDGAIDEPKLRVRNIAHGLVEVGMIQDVECLRSDLQLRAFPFGNAEVLHQSEICVEVHWAITLVAPLIPESKSTSRT